MAATKRAPQQQPSLAEMLSRHNDLTAKIAFMEALLDLCRSSFEYQDGVEPESLVVTDDGRPVGSDIVTELLTSVESSCLTPLRKELEKLSKVKL